MCMSGYSNYCLPSGNDANCNGVKVSNREIAALFPNCNSQDSFNNDSRTGMKQNYFCKVDLPSTEYEGVIVEFLSACLIYI